MKSLVEAGHEVTVVSHFPETNPPENYKDLPLTGLKSLVNAFDLEVCLFCLIKVLFIQFQSFFQMFKWRPPYFHFMEFYM